MTERLRASDATVADVPGGVGLAVASVASVQFGAALAARLFSVIGPIGTVSLRLLGAGVVLVLLTRPWRLRWRSTDVRASALLALIFMIMNSSLYLALDRLPLGTVITLEFLGPLTLSIVTARSWSQRIWAVPAGLGVALLGGSLSSNDLLGAGFALTAAAAWAAYILVNGRLGRTGTGLAGLSVATAFAAILMLPIGAFTAGLALWHPGVLAVGLAVGVLSSAVPYSFDLLALRRLPTAVFGILTSLNPAVAALAGLLVLSERLPLRPLGGIALVTLASAGISLSAARSARSARRPAEGPSGQQVGVDVEDALAGVSAGIEDGPERAELQALGGAGDAGDHHGGYVQVGPELDNVTDVHTRNDEHVDGRLRVDVTERDHRVVGVDDLGRDVAGHNGAEQAILGHNG